MALVKKMTDGARTTVDGAKLTKTADGITLALVVLPKRRFPKRPHGYALYIQCVYSNK